MIGQPLFAIEPHSQGAFRARMAKRLIQAQGINAMADSLRRAYNNRRAGPDRTFCVLVDGRAMNVRAASKADVQIKFPAATAIVPVASINTRQEQP